jgi:beta-aspartyl-dipeptidase (metallo-type)
MGFPSSNLKELADAVLIEKIPLETALKVLTSNVSAILKLPGKGVIAPGMDADLLFLNPGLEMVHLMAMGKWAVRDGRVVKKGTYE